MPPTPIDSLVKPRKYSNYILTRFPVDVDLRLAESHRDVYSVRLFIQDGSPTDRIDFLPYLASCEMRKLENDQP